MMLSYSSPHIRANRSQAVFSVPHLRVKSLSSERKQKKHRIKIKNIFSPHREYTYLSCIQHIFLKSIVKSKWKDVCFTHATCPPTNKVQYWHSQDIQEELAAVTVRTLNHNPKQKHWAASNLLLKPASLDSQGIVVGRKVEEKGTKHLEKKDQWSLSYVSCLLEAVQATSSLWDAGKALASTGASEICLNVGPPKRSHGWRDQPAFHYSLPTVTSMSLAGVIWAHRLKTSEVTVWLSL